MSQCLPTGGFKWLTPNQINELDIHSLNPEAGKGLILEVDLEYSHELQDLQMIIPWQRRKWESPKICFHLIAARNNTIKFINKPLSNIGLLHWVKPLGIKYFRGIYSCDTLPEILVQSEYPAGKRVTPNDNLISWLWTIIRTIVGTVLSLNLQLIITKWAKPKKRWSTGTRKMATIFSWVIDYDLITKTIHDYMEGVRVPCKFCNREFLSKETPKIHYKIIHWIEKKK